MICWEKAEREREAENVATVTFFSFLPVPERSDSFSLANYYFILFFQRQHFQSFNLIFLKSPFIDPSNLNYNYNYKAIPKDLGLCSVLYALVLNSVYISRIRCSNYRSP